MNAEESQQSSQLLILSACSLGKTLRQFCATCNFVNVAGELPKFSECRAKQRDSSAQLSVRIGAPMSHSGALSRTARLSATDLRTVVIGAHEECASGVRPSPQRTATFVSFVCHLSARGRRCVTHRQVKPPTGSGIWFALRERWHEWRSTRR